MTRRGQDTQLPLLGVGGPVRLIHGDSLAVLPLLAADSVDAIVTDPPYGLAFMGKEFDKLGLGVAQQEWHRQWAVEALRVLKPGGYLIAFGGDRTHHRLMVAVEDAGFEIRTCLYWCFGSGFPKSLDISKALDRIEGAEREVVGISSVTGSRHSEFAEVRNDSPSGVYGDKSINYITAPSTEAARQWDGWGTALKPAIEIAVLARKPLSEDTVARNVLAHGTGALNIDACRVPGTKDVPASMPRDRTGHGILGAFGTHAGGDGQDPTVGRWPANVVHDGSEEVEAAFAAYGARGQCAPVKGTEPSAKSRHVYGTYKRTVATQFQGRVDSAARFFYTARYDEVELLFWRAKSILFAWNRDLANSVENSFYLQKEHVVSVLNDVVTLVSRGEMLLSDCRGLSTNVTPHVLKTICETIIIVILNSEKEQSLDLQQGVLIQNGCLVSVVGMLKQTGTMTITINLQKLDGCVEDVMLSITSVLLGVGDLDCKNRSRFMYTAKASGEDREFANDHPTVKPLALMRWLVRLVTRPGGVVLDPFMGSGSTGRACQAEGFRFIGIEREAAYVAIAQRRLLAQEVEVLP